MSADITLPGSIPTLLRSRSPVIAHDQEQHIYGERCVYIGEHLDTGLAVVWRRSGEVLVDYDDLVLDLTDATGRAHAAWWLAAKGVKWWPDEPNYTTATWRAGQYGAFYSPMWELGRQHWWPADFHVFAGLSHGDSRLLPDGSRWVDAEALRLIVLHTAGVPDAE